MSRPRVAGLASRRKPLQAAVKTSYRKESVGRMIRQLHDGDRAALAELLEQEPARNLYLLGNMEALGFTAPYCQFWGDLDEAGGLRAVINRYMIGWSVYGLAGSDWAGLAQVIDEHPVVATRLQDNPGGVESLLPFLHRYRAERVHVEELMELRGERFNPSAPPAGVELRRASLADLAELARFYAHAGHMARTPTAVERPLRDRRIWVADEDGYIVAAALTNAETAALAMVGGVYTPEAQRGRGLASAVCSALCAELLAEGKTPVLYWDTPAAGHIYRKLGFVPLGRWRSVWLTAGE